MYRMAADLLRGTSIPFSALLPLIDQTAAKVHTLAPQDAQTGPAARGDDNVIARHMQLLNSLPMTDKALPAVYQVLTDYIRDSKS